MSAAEMYTQEYIDERFDLAERHEREVNQLGVRAALATATIDLCEAHRGGVLREFCGAWSHGKAKDIGERARMIDKHCAAERRAFLAVWRRGSSAIDNMRVIETAVQGYTEMFDQSDEVRTAVERVSLGLMRSTVCCLSAAGEESPGHEAAIVDAQDSMDQQLDAVLEALRANGGTTDDAAIQASQDAEEAVRHLLELGYDPERLQIELDWWSRATGGPAVRIEQTPTT